MFTNVSSLATIETDEERSFFLIDLPCRSDMVKNLDIEKIVRYNDTKESGDFTKDFIKDFTKENNIEISERQYDILLLLTKDHTLTSQKISQKISQKKPVSMRTILKDLAELQQKGFLRREGGRKNGYWQLLFLPLD
jgi:ATP-dependent DNA helicase RecG